MGSAKASSETKTGGIKSSSDTTMGRTEATSMERFREDNAKLRVKQPDSANMRTQKPDAYTEIPNPMLSQIRKHNVDTMMVYTVTNTLFFSMCQWTVFDAYINLLAKHNGYKFTNSWVGLAESISGLVSLALAIPVGMLVDKVNRVSMCRWAAVIGILSTAVSIYSFATDSIAGIMASLFLWGIYYEASDSPAQAIFADSLPQGGRSEAMTLNGMIATACMSLGPGILIVLFYFAGDNWTLEELHVPLLAGCCVAPFACFTLYRFKDASDLGSQSAEDSREPLPPGSPLLPGGSESGDRVRRESISHTVRRESLIEGVDISYLPQALEEEFTSNSPVKLDRNSWKVWSVPYIVTGSDLIRKIGAGMTVKFFGLFFINDYGFTPVQLSELFCLYPLCISVFMQAAQKISKPLGRVQAVTLWQVLGLLSLILMVYVENVWIVVIVFLVRGSFTNAVFPIDRSIVMDYVPSQHRGKWNAVESLTSMTWAGSAIFGGLLVDLHDYRYTFLITAVLYAISLLVYLPLLWLVPKQEKLDFVNSEDECVAANHSYPLAEDIDFNDDGGCYHTLEEGLAGRYDKESKKIGSPSSPSTTDTLS